MKKKNQASPKKIKAGMTAANQTTLLMAAATLTPDRSNIS